MNVKFYKLSLAALLAALVAVAVGVMVWPTPEEAKADETHSIIVRRLQGGDPVEGVYVRITVWKNGQWQQASGYTDANGVFTNATLGHDQAAVEWFAEVIDTNWIVDFPANPQAVLYEDHEALFEVDPAGE